MEQKPKTEQKQPPQEIKYLVRIAKTDLKGEKAIAYALTKIKGVGYTFACLACNLADVDKTKKAGVLTDDEVSKLNNIIENPIQHNIPSWVFNRQRDFESNTDKHLLTNDLDFTQENDVKRLRKIKCYRGVRHSAGKPVRGQRTRSNFRKNKGKVTLGVQRKKVSGKK
ncbi:MAG: 30S ribosomal protein S13 [Nanoarchaeota archaeon]|nr:30S ribosomal protein S13 [Nanoarchaeota archaeon]